MRAKLNKLLRNERFLLRLEIGIGVFALLFILILLGIFFY